MFTFEHTHQVTEAEYVLLFGLHQPNTAAQWARRLIILAVGLILLLWPYTLALGVVILASAAFAILMPHLAPGTAARTFRQMRYLAQPVTYGVNDHRLWVRGQEFATDIPWHLLTVWRERADWLILQANAFPPVLLPIADLKSSSSYDRIIELAGQHAVKFGSVEAQLRF
jgi:hypothetical protein